MPSPDGVQVFPITGLGEVMPGTDLAALIAGAVAPADPGGPELAAGDVVVVTQKIVSKAEGRLVELDHADPEAKQALTNLAATLATTERVMKNVDAGTAPALKQLPGMTTQLQKTVTDTNKLLLSLDSGYGDNTKFNRDLERLLVQTNDALSSIRALADLLSRHPEALIKGRPAGGVE